MLTVPRALDDTSVSFCCALGANVAFWVVSFINIYVDHLASSGQSKTFRQLKLQSERFLSREELKDTILVAFFNMVVLGFFVCCPMFEILWNTLHGEKRLASGDDWNIFREVVRIPVDMVVNEVTFYAAHYVLHRPFFFKHIHKVHHRFHAPSAITAAYAHPIEFIFGNVLCIALGPILTNAHPYTSYFWFTSALLSTCKGHSGYNILNAQTHDAHHQYTNYNFGVLHFADFFMGTSLPDSHNAVKKL